LRAHLTRVDADITIFIEIKAKNYGISAITGLFLILSKVTGFLAKISRMAQIG